MSPRSDLLPASGGEYSSGFQQWCLVIAAVGTSMLFYLGAQPFAAGLFLDPWDKLAHFVAFSAITALLWVGSAGRIPLALIVIVSSIGALDEWHQAGLPGRSMDIADLLTDMGAATLTVIILRATQKDRLSPEK
jgi:VanZ family protein